MVIKLLEKLDDNALCTKQYVLSRAWKADLITLTLYERHGYPNNRLFGCVELFSEGQHKGKHQSITLLVFSCGGFPHKGTIMRKASPCHDVIISRELLSAHF